MNSPYLLAPHEHIPSTSHTPLPIIPNRHASGKRGRSVDTLIVDEPNAKRMNVVHVVKQEPSEVLLSAPLNHLYTADLSSAATMKYEDKSVVSVPQTVPTKQERAETQIPAQIDSYTTSIDTMPKIELKPEHPASGLSPRDVDLDPIHIVFAPDTDQDHSDGTRCICRGHRTTASENVRCPRCNRYYHKFCWEISGVWSICPLCTLRVERDYAPNIRVTCKGQEDDTMSVDVRAMLKYNSQDIVFKRAEATDLVSVDIISVERENTELRKAVEILYQWQCGMPHLPILQLRQQSKCYWELQKAIISSCYDRLTSEVKNTSIASDSLHEFLKLEDEARDFEPEFFSSNFSRPIVYWRRRTVLFDSLTMDLGIAAEDGVLYARATDERRMFQILGKLLSIWEIVRHPDVDDEVNELLNLVQEVIDSPRTPVARCSLASRVLLDLSLKTGIIPSSLFLKRVVTDPTRPSIGVGAYADVFEGEYEGELVALKRLRLFSDPTQFESHHKALCREALPWRQLRHPRIVPFLGIDCDSHKPYRCMVSPLMTQGNLSNYLKRHGTNVDTFALMADVAEGLEYLHTQRCIHGDLRAANVFINDDERACISDFGLITYIESVDNNSTRGGGNPRWTAPEVQSGESLRTLASDIYSFGCLCIELITGNIPFAEIKIPAVVVFKVISGERPGQPYPTYFVSAPEKTWALITRCWSQDPKARPTASEVVTELEQIRSQ